MPTTTSVLDVELKEPYLLCAGDFFRATDGEFWVIEDFFKSI